MGLDVYVGTLTRYHAGAWKTIVQQAMEAEGIPVRITRSNPEPADAIRDRRVIEETVRSWQTLLADAVRRQSGVTLSWEEGMSKPYFTDKPDWDGYAGVVLLAAYSGLGLSLPKKLDRDWQKDKRINEAKKKRLYRQILEPEWWLPVEADLVFEGPTPSRPKVMIGSCDELRSQLRELTTRALHASEADLGRWRQDGPPDPNAGDLDHSSRFGLSVFAALADKAVGERLPMLLDY